MASPGHEFNSKHPLGIIDSVPALIHTGRPDGHLDYFNQRWLDLQDASGNREFVGVGIDITSIKRAEEELCKSESNGGMYLKQTPI